VIAHLSGEVLSVRDQRIVVDVGGVGYEVFAPAPTCLGHGPGAKLALHVRTLVREDAIQLFGFETAEEKELFVLVTGVTGMGPKLGLALLSELPPGELARAIGREDLTRLTRVSGIGKKTAERLCLELKDKVLGLTAGLGAAPAPRAAEAGAAPADPLEDAVSALVNLGYPRARADTAVRQAALDSPDATLEELVRRGLAGLGRNP
jgi:Holliday junction DNA helicase RuvA